ncbi:hypothetical protein D9758_013959 [Tetrapyrgos nigripes]|uniref:XPG-I domain-containing protein n=1 Tax=Tetrapyrgos nigripes TaxID=182062 RepID=A0A8H5LJX4_9AGAR|nr:hypothetical protein D9758_013959 [Tetrapyrgos nigripes]
MNITFSRTKSRPQIQFSKDTVIEFWAYNKFCRASLVSQLTHSHISPITLYIEWTKAQIAQPTADINPSPHTPVDPEIYHPPVVNVDDTHASISLAEIISSSLSDWVIDIDSIPVAWDLIWKNMVTISMQWTLVFIFDGPSWPQIKCSKYAFIPLIEMSFPNALSEAEVKLAYMNKAGIIDTVLTDDSDVLIFGT